MFFILDANFRSTPSIIRKFVSEVRMTHGSSIELGVIQSIHVGNNKSVIHSDFI